ncbi:type II toxin-antitoxin system RelE/ParE family toxin [Enterococcus mundtii]|uniref:type II toxin-antitoxin system RelE/ParE family toxin n=1 Tax=Enterococcus mundtii TaxID=53346 RepID=UPI003B21FB96
MIKLKKQIYIQLCGKSGKKLQSNLYEVRASMSSNALRGIYFQRKGHEYFITHGFRKKANKLSRRELEKGRKLRDNFLSKNERWI